MICKAFAALLAVTSLGVSASPLERRQDASTTATENIASAITPTATTTTREIPSAGLVVITNADGQPTTIIQDNPNGPGSTVTPTVATGAEATRTGQPIPPANSKDFPYCTDENAKPFCKPENNATMYVGETYYVTWNPKFFPSNTTVTIRLMYDNVTTERTERVQAWSSDPIDVSFGFETVTMQQEWLQGFGLNYLKFFAVGFQASRPDEQAAPYDGPSLTLKYKPPTHYKPDSSSKFNKEGLLIGLPVGLGALFFVAFGLYWGNRKQRQIGLGNIMSRKRHGYGDGKSRPQRLGLSKLGKKKGAIRLEERELALRSQPTQPQVPTRSEYRDAERDHFEPAPLNVQNYSRPPQHRRDESLGSLVDEDERPRGNAFRDEIRRQQTGR